MIVFKNAEDLNQWCKTKKSMGFSVGFVPTMGALHNGHASLIDIARANHDYVVCSIFVNPTQFNEASDFEKYPISIEADKSILHQHDCDVVFIPDVQTVYPNGKEYKLDIELGEIAEVLEGAHRPGHFDGVIQVVKRLLEIVEPNLLYLGLKDYQQYLIIKKMVAHYQMPLEVVGCPIVREADGLAMSSRNRRLTEEERKTALNLSATLHAIENEKETHSPKAYAEIATEKLNAHPLVDVEYFSIVDAENLQEIDAWKEAKTARACVAAWVGKIRLIDNVSI